MGPHTTTQLARYPFLMIHCVHRISAWWNCLDILFIYTPREKSSVILVEDVLAEHIPLPESIRYFKKWRILLKFAIRRCPHWVGGLEDEAREGLHGGQGDGERQLQHGGELQDDDLDPEQGTDWPTQQRVFSGKFNRNEKYSISQISNQSFRANRVSPFRPISSVTSSTTRSQQRQRVTTIWGTRLWKGTNIDPYPRAMPASPSMLTGGHRAPWPGSIIRLNAEAAGLLLQQELWRQWTLLPVETSSACQSKTSLIAVLNIRYAD